MDMTITLSGVRGAPAGVEPCERCGTPVYLMSLRELLRSAPTMPERIVALCDDTGWVEIHDRIVDDRHKVSFRQHSPGRCTSARAGHPEPLDVDDLDDGQDDEDDL